MLCLSIRDSTYSAQTVNVHDYLLRFWLDAKHHFVTPYLHVSIYDNKVEPNLKIRH